LSRFLCDYFSVLLLGRKVGFLPMMFFGLFGIPLGIPKPVPLTVLLGKPIEIPKIDNPSKADIDKYHTRLIASVETLYNENRAEYGYADVPLRIL